MEKLNENIIDADEIFAECSTRPSSNFKNSRKISIFGKSSVSTESRRTTDFTLSSKIDEDQEYEKKRNEEIELWLELVSNAKEKYLRTKRLTTELTIHDLPEDYRNFLKDQIDFVNLHSSTATDSKFEEAYFKFAEGAKRIESKKKFLHDYTKFSIDSTLANVKDKLFS